MVSGIKWRTFPVTYAIDATNSHIDINAAKAAVRKAFAAFDALNHPAGTFFQETSSYSSAKIKVIWKYLDGPYNKLGYTTFSYRTDTKALTSATVTLDSGDKFFVSSTERCGAFGSQFDVQNIATHEIGHAINLGHVSDKLQSMYPTSYAGETLKRTLGTGDKLGVTRLY
jgi:predicted Zn-dependent protease